MRTELVNSLALAYVGDAVFEVLVRDYLLEQGIVKVHELQKKSIQYVSAYAQAEFVHFAMENDFLTEREIAIYKRGRNTKGRKAKNVIVHNQSTGFEAIIGTLHLEGNEQRIEEIFAYFVEAVEMHKLKKIG